MLSKNKAFTLMEMLIAMTVISILMAASVPLITQMSKMKTGMDKNVTDCINKNTSTGWYNTDSAGATTLPAAGTSCYGAVVDVTNNRDNAFNVAYWTAVNGTTAQKIMAKRILRAACDQGGTKACDYFINNCRINGSASSPYCDDTTDFTDITYYLHLNRTNYENKGATYIVEQLTDILPTMPAKLLSEAFYAKTVNPNANNNLAYNLAQPSVYIKACNNGITSACATSFGSLYNLSCYRIKYSWPEAPSGNYRITYVSNGTSESKYCNMNSLASAAIDGCNSITANQWVPANYNDCYSGRLYNFNRTCNQVFNVWPEAPVGTYKLTSVGATAATVVSTACPIADPDCLVQGPGTVCADTTVYAGDYNGFHYYTPPVDQGIRTWGTSASTTYTHVNDYYNGQLNTDLLNARTDPPDSYAPYQAAGACKTLNDTSAYGYTDWYLPARLEIVPLNTNRTAIGGFTYGAIYWTSTEASADSGAGYVFTTGAYYSGSLKWENQRVRCVRKSVVQDPLCLIPGEVCSDGFTKYAGPFNGYYLYTTPADQGLYPWNNGTYVWTVTGATDGSYGKNNTDNLLARTNPPDGNAPYPAALACKELNDTSAYGYTDWYLPASNEVWNTLMTNAYLLGNAASDYWSSTERDPARAYSYSVFGGYSNASGKGYLITVRCVRRSL